MTMWTTTGGLPTAVRVGLLASGPLNFFGAVLLSPPGHRLREVFGFPDGPPLYLWVLSLWVFAFGVAYVYVGVTNRRERGVLALGAWGKAVFFGLVAVAAQRGEVSTLAAVGALPDLVLALVFAWGVRSTS